jgi:hypothetical protein
VPRAARALKIMIRSWNPAHGALRQLVDLLFDGAKKGLGKKLTVVMAERRAEFSFDASLYTETMR